MPPTTSRPRGRFRRFLWIVLALASVVALGAWVFVVSLGQWLYHEDPLENADAIFVLGGNWLDRVVESGDLYLEGRAPVVVLSRELPDQGERALRARGVDAPSVTDVQSQALVAMGVPRAAIHIVEPQVATSSEALTLRDLAAERGWRRVIVVTSNYHTGRARLVFERRFRDRGVQIVMRGSRYDPWTPDTWREHRVWVRLTLIEGQKMLLSWVGVTD